MTLDCSSYEAAKKSLISIFKTSELELLHGLRRFDLPDYRNQLHLKNLYNHICDVIGHPLENISVTWFHGTRAENDRLFIEHGILPKSEAIQFIKPKLEKLSYGLETFGSYPNEDSIEAKEELGDDDDGPFAFLFREVCIQAPDSIRSYHDTPELVEDIAGSMLGENYKQLVDRYKQVTTPYIVSFLAECSVRELSGALLYVKLVEDGESDIDAAKCANIYFNSKGVIVEPNRIKGIEIVEDS